MSVVLSYKTTKAIDVWLKKYPADQKQSAVIYALMCAQEENSGCLTEPLMNAVAAYLEMPRIAVYEVATFYSMFDLEPVGRYKISLCTNVSCQLCEAEEIAAHLKKKLSIDFNQTTPDGRFTLKEVECLAACGGAPAMMIGRRYYERLTPQKIDTILEGLE